jgi:DNA mismatch repair protein MutS
MLLYEKYYIFYEELTKKYKKVALLLQVGSFFEIYSPQDCSRTNICELSRVMNIRYGLKDHKSSNPYMFAGFPVNTVDKFIKILVQQKYTVVLVEQVSRNTFIEKERSFFSFDGSSGEKRAITHVISPGTDFTSDKIQNNVMSIYIQKFITGLVSFSIAICDTIISNEIYTYHYDSFVNDKGFAIDAVVETILQYDPVECIIIRKNGCSVDDIVKKLGVKCDILQMDTQQIKETKEIAVKGLEMYLSDRFIDTSKLSVVESSLDGLDLSATCILQLDIKLLYKLLNKTRTNMGARYLYNRLFKPSRNFKELQYSFDQTSSATVDEMDDVKTLLTGIYDIEKLTKKLSLGILSMSEFMCLMENSTSLSKKFPELTRDFLIEYNITLEQNDQNLSFKKGIHKDLDESCILKDDVNKNITDFINLAKIAIKKKNVDTFKIKDGIGISTTKLRAIEIKKKYPDWCITNLKSDAIVYTAELQSNLQQVIELQEEISKMEKYYWKEFQTTFYETHKENLTNLSKGVSLLDFGYSSWVIKEKYKLTRPILVSSHKLEIKGLRHLIIENIDESVMYIPNDISFSQENIGNIIYGINSCGKTSLLKATGLAVVMAQAGLHVPATEMTFCPFKRIMTRIAGGDNMEKSQSSFIVELEEMLSIIQRADKDTLVLGDEICRGTESNSAIGINYAFFNQLVDKEIFFICATHLHELHEYLNDNKNISVFHMKADFEQDSIVFDRKLLPGSGPKLYGLEVARNLNFPQDFLEKAFKFRTKTLQTSTIKTSRFNSKKIIEKCQLCDYKPSKSTDIPNDIHHLLFQCNSVDGYHNTQHKNALHNLVCLCKDCHVKVHQGLLKIKVKQHLDNTSTISLSP